MNYEAILEMLEDEVERKILDEKKDYDELYNVEKKNN